MSFLYRALRIYVRFIFKIYYKEVEIIGMDRIPQQGPLILVGNHNNLYLDGAVMYSSNQIFVSVLDRSVSIVTAAASFNYHPVLDIGLKLTGAIPISRAWDQIYVGKGRILTIENGQVIGKDTQFSQCKGGDTLQLKNGQQLRITSIQNDELMRIKQTNYSYHEEGTFRIIPRPDNSASFDNIWAELNEDKCISIFPQGYSHDRFELLPFKNGVCVAAFGVLEKYGKKVTIVPCGLTYQNQAKFRSTITIQVGKPIEIDDDLAQLYKKNCSEAIKTLLNKIVQTEQQLVFDFRHYDRFEELRFIHIIVREEYQDRLTPMEKIAQLRRVTCYYSDCLKERNNCIDETVQQAMMLSKKTGLQQCFHLLSHSESAIDAIISSITFIFTLLLMLPGYLLYFPAMLIIIPKIERERISCLQYTKNRINALDSVASASIMYSSVILPIAVFISFAICYFMLVYRQWSSFSALLLCLAGFFLQPFYMLLFVQLWDAQKRAYQSLKRYFAWTFKKSSVLKLSNLCQKILSEISLKKPQETSPQKASNTHNPKQTHDSRQDNINNQ